MAGQEQQRARRHVLFQAAQAGVVWLVRVEGRRPAADPPLLPAVARQAHPDRRPYILHQPGAIPPGAARPQPAPGVRLPQGGEGPPDDRAQRRRQRPGVPVRVVGGHEALAQGQPPGGVRAGDLHAAQAVSLRQEGQARAHPGGEVRPLAGKGRIRPGRGGQQERLRAEETGDGGPIGERQVARPHPAPVARRQGEGPRAVARRVQDGDRPASVDHRLLQTVKGQVAGLLQCKAGGGQRPDGRQAQGQGEAHRRRVGQRVEGHRRPQPGPQAAVQRRAIDGEAGALRHVRDAGADFGGGQRVRQF